VAIQPHGAIVVVGTSGSHAVVVSYTSRGRLDARFGRGGVVPVDFPGLQSSLGIDLALQPDGRIIIVGQTLTAVARLKSDGSFDRGFGSGGTVLPGSLPAIDNQAAAVALQSDGKIVLAVVRFLRTARREATLLLSATTPTEAWTSASAAAGS
jgi:uncharacterized delta-60 repeat protein